MSIRISRGICNGGGPLPQEEREKTKMLKVWLGVLFAGAFLLPCAAGNLLKNSDFADLTGAGLPRDWTLRGAVGGVVAEKNSLTLGGDAGQGVLAIQHQLPVKPGISYTMSWFAAGRAPYKCYVEYVRMADGVKNIKGFHYNLMTPSEQGSTRSFSFAVPDDAVRTYVVFSVKSAEKVTFSKLRLLETAEAERAEGLLENSDFSVLNGKGQPVGWSCRGAADDFRFSAGQAEVKGKDTFLVGSLSRAIGKSGLFSCRVAGEGKYRIYVEWYWQEDGKKRSRSTRAVWSDALPEGQEFSLPFRIPAAAKSAILAVRVDAGSFLSFSQMRVKEENADTSQAPSPRSFVLSPKAVQRVALPKLVPGRRYKITYSVRGAGATGNDTVFHFFKLHLVNSFDNLLASFPAEDCLERSQNKAILFTAPENKHPNILKIVSQSAGELEFKDLRIEPFAEDIPYERLVITSPRFRSTFYSSLPEDAVSGRVFVNTPFAGGEAVLKAENGRSYRAPLEKKGDGWHFTLPGESGQLEVSLIAPDGKKKLLTEQIRRLPPAPVEVIPGPGRRLHVNGRPFIPIEISRNAVPLEEMAYHGGTCVRRPAPATAEDCLEILDQGQRVGLKIILSFMNTVPRVADEAKLRLWHHRAENLLTKEVLAHPALLGYVLDDEPYWNGVPLKSLRPCFETLRKLDPYRPVWICFAPRGSVEEQRPYTDCCDIAGVDIYPVPAPTKHSHLEDKTLSCVGKYVRRMAEITDGTRPVAIWLQGFAWEDFRKDPPRKTYPTWTESRFMVFDAVINSADTFFWYGLWLISSPEFYDDLMKVIRELHSLTGVLAAENGVPGKVSDDAVEYRCYHGQDWSCTIAANTRDREAGVRFTAVPGVPEGEIAFEPYEVKIFSEGKLPAPLTPLPAAAPERLTYRKQVAAKRDSVPYTAPEGMKWIWGGKEKSIAGSRIFARVKFPVKSGLKKAFLRVAADDFTTGIILDGKALETAHLLKDFHFLDDLDVTALLTPGDHVLCIEARDGGRLPCGLLAELRLEYADGAVTTLPTGAAWETAPEMSGPWSPAAVLKKVGEKPWGMPRLLLPRSAEK